MNITIATGGSGGHVIPALKVARELQKRKCEVRFAGAFNVWKERIAQAGFPFDELELRGMNFTRPWELPRTLWLYLKGTFAAGSLLKQYKADVVVGFGGYGAFPVVLAAVLSGRPTLIHEQNVLPGKANAVLSRLVKRIAVSFPQSRKYFRGGNVVLTGCPSHTPGVDGVEMDTRELLKEFGLREGRKTILVLGGSQGSRRLNEIFLEAVAGLKNKMPLQVIHLCGQNGYPALKEQYARLGIPFALFAFFEAMERVYPAADLVIGRAGAVSVTELIRFRKPSVLIPYPHAGGHQTKNAEVLAQAGVGEFIEQKNFTAAWLSGAVERMLAKTPSPQEWERHFGELLSLDPAAALADQIVNMEPHGLKPVVPGLPRLALRNRISDFKGKVPEISRKFLGIRYGKILFDNFAILVGVIRRHATSAESACSIFLHSRKYRTAPRLFTAFIHGLKSRGILRRRIKQ